MKFSEFTRFGVRSKRIAIVLSACLVVYTVSGFFLLPIIAKPIIIEKLSEALGRTVSLDRLKVNPFMLSATVSGLKVQDKDNGIFVSLDALYANLQLSSLVKQALVLRKIQLDKPYVRLARDGAGVFNFADLISDAAAKSQTAGAAGVRSQSIGPPPFVLRDVGMDSGKIDFIDAFKQVEHTVKDIRFSLPFASSLPEDRDIDVAPQLSAIVNGASVQVSGQSRPFAPSMKTRLHAAVRAFDLPGYVPYLPMDLNARLQSGSVDLETTWTYEKKDDGAADLVVSGPITLNRFNLLDAASSPLANIPALRVVVAPSNLLSRDFHIAKVDCTSPDVRVTLNESSTLNLLEILPSRNAEKNRAEPEPVENGVSLQVDQVAVSDGRIAFTDRSRAMAFQTTLHPIDIAVNGFSLEPENETAYTVSVRTETDETLDVSGNFSLAPIASRGNIKLNHLVPGKYAPYYQDLILFDVDDGTCAMAADFDVHFREKTPDVAINGLAFSLNNLKLKHRDSGDLFCNIPAFSIENGAADTATRNARIGKCVSENGFLLVRRSENGVINLQALAAPVPLREPDEVVENGKSPSPWMVSLDQVALNGYAIRVEDRMVQNSEALEIDQIRFYGNGLSTRQGTAGQIELSTRWNQQGTVEAKGAVELAPVSADMSVKLKGIGLAAAQPYIADRIALIISKGALSVDGRLSARLEPDREPDLRFLGQLAVSDFSTIDRAKGKDFLSWNSLYLSDIDMGYSPLSLSIQDVALTDFFCHLLIYEDGKINLGTVLAGQQEPETADAQQAGADAALPPQPADAGSVRNIAIETVTLQNGTIDFTDQLIQPSLKLDLLNVTGRISGLSSMDMESADVFLKGQLQNHSPLEIKGKINPLIENVYADISLFFSDIDMPAFTPYTGKYLGYALQKGKLTLDLKYKVAENKLAGENKIYMDQLTLGEKVESPDATSLPVSLAIALLKDKNGRIDLDVPIQGDLNNPEFSLGKTIVRVIVNLFTKIVTSPFALIGELFGGGEELSFMEFDFGESQLRTGSVKKLDALVKALNDRPALNLEIEGAADPEKDREALTRKRSDELIKTEKFKETVAQGGTAVAIEDMTISPEEYEKYITMAYEQAEFPKPRNEFGQIKALPITEMEKLLYTHIQIPENALRQLAVDRAIRIKDYLVEEGRIPAERVFTTEPSLQVPDAEEGRTNNRVNFKLK